MTVTRTITSLAPTVTQATLIGALKTAFTNAGLSGTPTDFTDGSSNRFLVYTIVYSAYTYGTIYFWVQVTSGLAVSCRVASDFNSGTNTSTNASAYSTAVTFGTSSTITLGALSGGTETNLVYMLQGTNYNIIGVLRPTTKRTTWDENVWPFVFVPTNNVMTSYTSFGTTLSFFANATYNTATIAYLSSVCSTDGLTEVLRAPHLFSSSNTGTAGQFSSDIGLVAGTGMSKLNMVVTATEKYLILSTTPGASSFCINVNA